MQTMKFSKLVKNFWWNFTAFKTLNDLPDSVILVNKNGEIKQFNNRAKLTLGLSCDESNTLRFDEIIKNGMEIVEQSAQSAKPVFATVVSCGGEFYVEISAVPKGENYLVSIRDITRLTKELDNEDKTRKFNNEKNAMLALLEDDIKAPITSINGFSQGLLDGLGGELSEKQAKYVKIINNNSSDLYSFIDKLLQFSKAESSIYESDFHSFDIVNTLKAIVADYQDVIMSKNLEIEIDGNSLEKRNAYTDVPSVKDAFRNILESLIQMTESGYLTVKLVHPDENTCEKYKISSENALSYAQIVISATCDKIADDEIKYLCEPYAQLDKGKKNLPRALQLGTASIMIKRAGGFIDIYSDSNGVRFSIIIPIEKR